MAVSDATLVLGALGGDTTAFTELYDRYARLVRAICYDKAGDLNQAQDLAQEVFLRAFEKLHKLKEPDRFGPWLISISRNVCREFRRGKLRDRHVLVGLDPPETVQHAPREPEGRLAYLWEAMGKLTEKQRLALHVYYLQDQDVEQAQKLLGVSRSGLYRLLADARDKIEAYVREKEQSNASPGSTQENENET